MNETAPPFRYVSNEAQKRGNPPGMPPTPPRFICSSWRMSFFEPTHDGWVHGLLGSHQGDPGNSF